MSPSRYYYLLALLILGSILPSRSSTPPFVSFFPYYDRATSSREIAEVQKVTDARRNDPTPSYERGANPYVIHYAVYNFASDWDELAESIIEARNSNVEVQILVDQKQLSPTFTWNHGIKALRSAGFVYNHTQVGLTPEQQLDVELLGVASDGIMHLKLRLFKWLDLQTGTSHSSFHTGSFNPELGEFDDPIFPNNDTLVSFSGDDYPDLLRKYEAKYQSVLSDNRDSVNADFDDTAQYNVLFSPDGGLRAADNLIRWIDEEDELLLIWVFTLRNTYSSKYEKDLLTAIKGARSRGVPVFVATDSNMELKSLTSSLSAVGVPTYLCNNTNGEFHAMHSKNAVFGAGRGARVVSGSCNWSGAAMGSSYDPEPVNHEDTLWIQDDEEMALRFTSNFLAVLRSYEHQQVAESAHFMPYADVVRTLAAVEGFRTCDVAVKLNIDLATVESEKLWTSSVEVRDVESDDLVFTLKATEAEDGVVPFEAVGDVVSLSYPHGTVLQYYFHVVNEVGEGVFTSSAQKIVADAALPESYDERVATVELLPQMRILVTFEYEGGKEQ